MIIKKRNVSHLKKYILIMISLILLVSYSPLYAALESPENISWGYLLVGVLGGLGFFLYGMEKMSQGMKSTAGNKLRPIIASLTGNRFIALFVGAFFTMVIQSSSATTVMLVSFVQAGLMTFAQTVGVILGAGIGTTITAQLIAFKLSDYALLMVAAGVFVRIISRDGTVKNISDIVLGFGILFFGMKLMSDSMKPLRTYTEFIHMLRNLENPWLGILAGTVFTAIIQSSSAFTGIIIVLAQQDLITLEAAIPLIFGANVGTCITALLASVGTTREAKRVAIGHIFFRILGVLIFVFWIPYFAHIIREIAAIFGSGTARQVANAHTFFNAGLALLFLPFTTLLAKLVTFIFPDKKMDDMKRIVVRHLDESVIYTPALAIDLARAEISRMANLLARMLRAIIIPFMSEERFLWKEDFSREDIALLIKEIPRKDEVFHDMSLIEGIDLREEKIDFLEEQIGNYLLKIARQELSKVQTKEVYGMISIAKDMESIGDIIHRNMLPLLQKKKKLKLDFTSEGKEELLAYHQKAYKQVIRLKDAFAERNLKKARKIMIKEKKYRALESVYRARHFERILHKREKSLETHEIHMELLEFLKQTIVYSSNIAKTYFYSCTPDQKS